MNSNTNNFRISNEQLLLINILNTMYTDNLTQINNLTNTLNTLYNSNTQIRNLLVQLLNTNTNSNSNSNSNTRRTSNNRRDQHTFQRTNNSNTLGRVYVDDRPYIIDSISQFTIPRRNNNNEGDSFTRIFNSFMQPVNVYPTQSQIESATRIVRYCDIIRPINNQCPISLESFNDTDMVTVIRPCNHIFNSEHISNWFRSNCRCPVCRYDIRDYNSTAATEFFSSNASTDFSSNAAIDFFSNESSINVPVSRSSSNNIERNNNESNNDNVSRNYSVAENFVDSLIDPSGNYISDATSNTILTNYLLNFLNQSRNA